MRRKISRDRSLSWPRLTSVEPIGTSWKIGRISRMAPQNCPFGMRNSSHLRFRVKPGSNIFPVAFGRGFLYRLPQPRRGRLRHVVEDRIHTSVPVGRSEEHTSELQSRRDLVCRLLLEKKKKK